MIDTELDGDVSKFVISRNSKTLENDQILTKLISCFNQNINRQKSAYRYTEETKQYCTYMQIIGGRLSYETFEANASHSVPSLRSVERYIAKTKPNVIEGVLRTKELFQYLDDHKVPSTKYKVLSEDATRINNRIQYDHENNQLVGFTLPLDEVTGMPIPRSYLGRSASEIEAHFYDIKTGDLKDTPSYINVVMAQPLTRGIPAFCLLIFGTDSKYSSSDIAKR